MSFLESRRNRCYGAEGQGQPLSRGKTVKQPRRETENVKCAEKSRQRVLSWAINMSLVCFAKTTIVAGVDIRLRQSGMGWWREERGELTFPLTPKLVKIFNVIEVKEIEQRSDLILFNRVSISANKNLKRKKKLPKRKMVKLSHKWRILKRWKILFIFSFGLSDYFLDKAYTDWFK